jgi:hypothetical protein
VLADVSGQAANATLATVADVGKCIDARAVTDLGTCGTRVGTLAGSTDLAKAASVAAGAAISSASSGVDADAVAPSLTARANAAAGFAGGAAHAHHAARATVLGIVDGDHTGSGAIDPCVGAARDAQAVAAHLVGEALLATGAAIVRIVVEAGAEVATAGLPIRADAGTGDAVTAIRTCDAAGATVVVRRGDVDAGPITESEVAGARGCAKALAAYEVARASCAAAATIVRITRQLGTTGRTDDRARGATAGA